MKYMKNLLVVSVICLSTFLIGCRYQFKYIEGKIYSETILKDNSDRELEQELVDFLTRDKAIEYAQGIFKDGFNITINRDKLRESINLSKAENGFYWNINWSETENYTSSKQYYILINSNTKNVRSCGIIRFNKDTEYYYNYYEANEEINYDDLKLALEIAKPMLDKMNINIDDYAIEGYDTGNRRILILRSEQEYYELIVDIELKELISFNSYGGVSGRWEF